MGSMDWHHMLLEFEAMFKEMNIEINRVLFTWNAS